MGPNRLHDKTQFNKYTQKRNQALRDKIKIGYIIK